MKRADYEARRSAVYAPLQRSGWTVPAWWRNPGLRYRQGPLDVYAALSGAFEVRFDYKLVARLGPEVPPAVVVAMLRAYAKQVDA